jgi:Type IV secretion-system coupling protein DNA-binding domain
MPMESGSLTERLTRQFYDWERLGRGWQVYDFPVDPEPPFRPFYDHSLPDFAPQDDGVEPASSLGSFFRALIGASERPTRELPPPEVEDILPEPLIREPLIELQALPPVDLGIEEERFAQFLFSLKACREPVAFELFGHSGTITTEFTVHPEDARHVESQLQAFFPDTVFVRAESKLEETWDKIGDMDGVVVEFGLEREFMFSLATAKIDPFVAITAGLAELKEREVGLFQVIFRPVSNPWSESALRAVGNGEGGSFFANAPEMVREAEKKFGRPLYAAVVRLAAKCPQHERAWEIVRNTGAGLGAFARPGGNELIPLSNDDYEIGPHEQDLVRRQSRRSGMLLNSEELIGFVHIPSSDIRLSALRRQSGKTKAAPKVVIHPEGLLLGENEHAGVKTAVSLVAEQRVRHMHVVGASGTGKSTLLFNMIRSDIEQGQGVAVLDPHGDLVDRVLGIVPRERIGDVIVLDPSDEEYSVGFNILSGHSELEKNLLASDLVSVFERLSKSWGDQMGSVLNNAIRAFLESSQGGTLADMRRFLLEPTFRNQFLETVRDPDIVYYWKKGFAQLAGNKSIGPVLTRLETFLSPKPIRYMVSQKENRLDFDKILDSGKILLAKLSQGAIGRENSFLLGSLLVAKIQQTAMSRQRQAAGARRDFWLYLDEFHNFITASLAEILTGARKYRIGLILAHQELRQLQRDGEVAAAVLANPYTRICFRVGDDDARKLADGFSFFEKSDLQNLSIGQAVCRVERSDFDFNLTVPLLPDPPESEAAQRRQEIIAASRRAYGTPRAKVEEMLYKSVENRETKLPTKPPAAAEREVSRQRVEEAPAPPKPVEKEPEVVKATPPAPEPSEDKLQAAIKERIGREAESLDYAVTFEESVLSGAGRVDVVLRRGQRIRFIR